MDLISNTPSKSHGRLEVLYDGKWGQICAENLDNAAAAKVACRSLGLDVRYELVDFGMSRENK